MLLAAPPTATSLPSPLVAEPRPRNHLRPIAQVIADVLTHYGLDCDEDTHDGAPARLVGRLSRSTELADPIGRLATS